MTSLRRTMCMTLVASLIAGPLCAHSTSVRRRAKEDKKTEIAQRDIWVAAGSAATTAVIAYLIWHFSTGGSFPGSARLKSWMPSMPSMPSLSGWWPDGSGQPEQPSDEQVDEQNDSEENNSEENTQGSG